MEKAAAFETSHRRTPEEEREQLWNRYRAVKARGLKLDMTRGKPAPEQLDLSNGLLECVTSTDYRGADGIDCRNYGGNVEGLPEARELFSEYLGVDPAEIVMGGNASLALLHDFLTQALLRGVPGGERPWSKNAAVKILCPVPGYDRHFTICEHYGIEMVPVAMGPEGPDMETVSRLSRDDDSVKGIICVPRYSNPTGITFTPETVRGLAGMKTLAPDFRILWDNAYAAHHLTDTPEPLRNGLAACKESGNPDRIVMFSSTSKISFGGAGVTMAAGSRTNVEWIRHYRSVQTIGPDKLNQLRHVRFFGTLQGIEAHMKKHAALVRPKFEAVQAVLEDELGSAGPASWSRPRGGYFISLDTPDGCARRVVQLAEDAGVRLTQAGATFPYGEDPRDRNIRIAPTLPPVDEVREATTLLAICVLLSCLEKRTTAGRLEA